MAEELEENNSTETSGTSNPFTMMLGATLGATAADNPDNWPTDRNGIVDGNYVEWAPKTNIRPWCNNKTPNKTAHIKSPDVKNVMKVVYSPDTNKDHAKTIWREDEIVIEGKTYSWVEVGNLCWMQQNLAISGTIGALQDINYPGKDIKNVEKFGLMYKDNQIDAAFIAAIPYPWRIATEADFQNLLNVVNTDHPGQNAATYLRATNAGSTSKYCGTDDYGVHLMNSGRFNNKSAQRFGEDCTLKVGDKLTSEKFHIDRQQAPAFTTNYSTTSFTTPVRLVRDRIVVNENN